MLEAYCARMQSVVTQIIAAVPGRHELTLKTTCVSSNDPIPRTLGPLDGLGNSSCSPVYIGLGKALANEVARDVITNPKQKEFERR